MHISMITNQAPSTDDDCDVAEKSNIWIVARVCFIKLVYGILVFHFV